MVARVLSSKPAKLAGAALAALSAVPFVGDRAAEGGGECDLGRPVSSKFLAGWFRYGASGDVALSSRANILVKDVYVDTIDVTAWTMLTNRQYLAQVGWIEGPANTRATFVEYHDLTGDLFFDTYPAYAVGTSPKYRVDYLPAQGGYPAAVQFYANFSLLHIGNSIPGLVPNEGQQFGEVQTLENQMPGQESHKERFFDSEVKFQSSGAYESFKGAYANDSAYWFGLGKISPSELTLWENYCP